MMSITVQAAAEYGAQGGHAGQPAPPSALWWGGIGSSRDQLKLLEHPAPVRQLGIQLQQPSAMLQSQPVEGPAQLLTPTMQAVTTHSGYDKGNGIEAQHQASSKTINCSTASECFVAQNQQELDHSIAHATYPYTDPYFGGIFAAYGAQAMIHPHMIGVQHARMPLRIETEEEPVYVNAKQYHGILRRRQLRAKAESEKKVIKVRKEITIVAIQPMGYESFDPTSACILVSCGSHQILQTCGIFSRCVISCNIMQYLGSPMS